MELKILFLCYDFMNLYGENGNIRLLERRLQEQGAKVTVDRKTISDEIDFSSYDFIYCGAGTESKRNMALDFLRPYREDLKTAIENGTPVLFTGNAWEMLGKSIKLGSGETVEGLNIFEFSSAESANDRITGDAILESSLFSEKFVGFINKCSAVTDVSSPLFTVLMGDGNAPGVKEEGFVYKNFFGTGLTGPVLIKNPHFLRHFLKLILKDAYQEQAYPYEEKGYEITLKELLNRMEH